MRYDLTSLLYVFQESSIRQGLARLNLSRLVDAGEHLVRVLYFQVLSASIL
jgi:hypothetical protein